MGKIKRAKRNASKRSYLKRNYIFGPNEGVLAEYVKRAEGLGLPLPPTKMETVVWNGREATPRALVLMRLQAEEQEFRPERFIALIDGKRHQLKLFFSKNYAQWFFVSVDALLGIAKRSIVYPSEKIAMRQFENCSVAWAKEISINPEHLKIERDNSMIRRCKCGKLKTVQPWDNAKELPWICDTCAAPMRLEKKHDIKINTNPLKPSAPEAPGRGSKSGLFRFS